MHRLLLPLALLATATPAAAQGPSRTAPPAPTLAEIRPADARTRVLILADDSMMGRLAGHPGNFMATSYIASEFRRLGLEPAGAEGHFQVVPMVRSGLAPGAELRVSGRPLALWADFAPLPYRANVFPYGGALLARAMPTIYGGRIGGEMIPAREARGKMVLLSPPLAADGRPNPRFWTVLRANPYPEAAAVAVISLEGTPPAVLEFLRASHVELDAGSAPVAGRPGLLLGTAAAERILGRRVEGLRPGAAGGVVTGGFRHETGPVAAPARNVIGLLRGSDPARAGQYVVISAHNDHEGLLGRALDHDSVRAYNRVLRPQGANDPIAVPTPEQAGRIRAIRDSLRAARGGRVLYDSIMNGADDDASGTAALLEIAEALAAGPRPRRSILFVSHTAEEGGLLGSRHFTDHPTVPRDSIVTALNMDMVGRGSAEDIAGGGPRYVQLIGSRRLSSELGALVDSLNVARREPLRIDYSFDAPGHPLNRYCRSDHFMYARHGIPVIYASRGYHVDYHMVTDEARYIDYDGLARVAEFVRDLAVAISDRPARARVDGPRQPPDAPCRQ